VASGTRLNGRMPLLSLFERVDEHTRARGDACVIPDGLVDVSVETRCAPSAGPGWMSQSRETCVRSV
jgi:hypothetical protein